MSALFPKVLRRGKSTRDERVLAKFKAPARKKAATKPRKSGKRRRKVIHSLIETFDSCCAMCGLRVLVELPPDHPMRATVDHILPLSRGGLRHDMTNLQLACYRCNQRKSSNLTLTGGDK